jgi:hypothetical protein
MMYRKGDGADSSVLSHPMLWLDERIFGKFESRRPEDNDRANV